jgi:hypothetical protein
MFRLVMFLQKVNHAGALIVYPSSLHEAIIALIAENAS